MARPMPRAPPVTRATRGVIRVLPHPPSPSHPEGGGGAERRGPAVAAGSFGPPAPPRPPPTPRGEGERSDAAQPVAGGSFGSLRSSREVAGRPVPGRELPKSGRLDATARLGDRATRVEPAPLRDGERAR